MLTAAPGMERFRFYGMGPQENYCDRRAGAILGLYDQTVTAQYVPYVMPQECGNHTGVRMAALDNGRAGLMAIAPEQMETSCHHFTVGDLLAGRHTYDVPCRPETFWHLDIGQRGVGTGSCGEDTCEQYRLHSGRYGFSLILKPFDPTRPLAW